VTWPSAARKNPTWTACLSFGADSSYTNNTDRVITDYDPIDMLDALVGQSYWHHDCPGF
jgi:hypothetical protein